MPFDRIISDDNPTSIQTHKSAPRMIAAAEILRTDTVVCLRVRQDSRPVLSAEAVEGSMER